MREQMVPQNCWDQFIQQEFGRPEAYIEPRKIKKKSRRSLQNKLVEIANSKPWVIVLEQAANSFLTRFSAQRRKKNYVNNIDIIYE